MSTPKDAHAIVSEPGGQTFSTTFLDLLQSRNVLVSLPAAVYTTDPEGRITFYNDAAAELWGCRPELGKSEFCGSWKLYRPDGTPLPHNECPMAIALKERRVVRNTEAVAERPDGTRVPFMPLPTPLFDRFGSFVGAVNILIDISDRKRSEELTSRKAKEQSALHRFTDRLYHAQSLEQVYDAGLQAIADVLNASRSSILLFDELGCMKFVAWRDLSDTYRNAVEGHSPWKPGDRNPKPIFIENVSENLGALGPVIEIEGIRALAFIPLMAHKTVIGKFMAYFDEPVSFDEPKRALLVTIARQLGFAILQYHAEEKRRRSEHVAQLYVALVSSSDDAIITKDMNSIVTSWNAGAERIFGYSSDEMVGQSITVLFPPDRQEEESEIIMRLQRGERIEHYETIRLRKDGTAVDVSLAVSPIMDEDGNVRGASKIARDITERRRNEEQQRLLLREMEHRMKNLFTLAGGIVNLSARSAASMDDLVSTISLRLSSLAKAQALTMSGTSSGMEKPPGLHALIRTILSPYADVAMDKRITILGPDYPLQVRAITSLALVFNEFATNAAKYGGLSNSNGKVAIECSQVDQEIKIQWREAGGPPLSGEPQERGFGTILADVTIAHQLGGQLKREWSLHGLIASLTMPLSRVILY